MAGQAGRAGSGGSGGQGSSGGSSSNASGSGAGAGDDASQGLEGGGDSALGAGDVPAACAAAAVGNTALGTDTPDATGTAVSAITYTNVGVAGSYDKVVTSTVAPTCVANVCTKTAKAVSGPLVPFDEEMTMVFSGPMDLYQVAAYEPGAGGYERVAYWDPCTTDGLAFVGNKAWYQCNGYVQSYVTDDGSASSPTPVQFAGHLDPGVGVNVMSSVLCTGTTDGTDCGFSRGLALHGFKGDAAGSRIFVTKFRMPIGDVTPAYWILPRRSCARRSTAATAAARAGRADAVSSMWPRCSAATRRRPRTRCRRPRPSTRSRASPTAARRTFSGPSTRRRRSSSSSTRRAARIAMRRLGATDFDFAAAIPSAVVDQWLANAGTSRAMP